MLQTYQTLKVFISSPSDVKVERDITESVIREVSDTCRDALGISLEIARWEKLPPETPNLSDEQIQDIINRKVKECNIFILILYKRYGTVMPGHKKSNTEREVETAIDMLLHKRQITFLSYFRDLPENLDLGIQERRVKKLRRDLDAKGIWFSSYPTPDAYKDRLTHDLYRTVLNFRLSTSKHKALSAFWQLGVVDRDAYPRLAIIYPPVDREFMKQESPDIFWCKRLVPHIVFEDFKALQKIEKSLRLIGFRHFRFYNTSNIPSDIREMNRVWVCVPRNARARQQAELYDRISKFKFAPRTPRSEAKLFWRYSTKSNKWSQIQSPLSKYLWEQRKNEPRGEWNSQKGKIIAKDFAIITRFSDTTHNMSMAEGTLKDYFIAGIRGLGTWGAAWFIDRRYDAFRYYEHENKNIQFLLEVTYRDERIFNVRDVSEKPIGYFEKENSWREIRRAISEYRKS